MKGFTDTPYKHDVFTVKQLGEHTIKIAYCSTLREAGWEEIEPKAPKGSVNDEKLCNNVARAKNTVKELVLCNSWDWWCTFTINPDKYDRKSLDVFMSDFAEFIHNYNRRRDENDKVKYILVPEQHKDGAWHLHGFIKGIAEKDIYVNQYGYYTWKQYEHKFGFISMGKIKEIDRASSYILKYMTKDTSKNVGTLHKHMFYSSKGLKRADVLYRGNAEFLGTWDWEHPDGYCKVKTIDITKESLYKYLEIVQYDNE